MKKLIYKIGTIILMVFLTNLAYSQIQITNTTNASSMSNCDGTAAVSASGTAGPFLYTWSTGSTSTTVTGLCQGIHYVTVTNAYECETVLSVNIGVDCSSDYSFYITGNVNKACLGTPNGSITGVKGQSDSPLIDIYLFME